MTYYESAEGMTISKECAKHEVIKVHQLSYSEWEQFLIDMGDKKEYNAQQVLGWLGY